MFRKILVTVIGLLILLLVILFVCDTLVSCNAKGRLYDSIDDVPQCQVGLLLGTTPQTRISGRKNSFFKYRIEAATELYKAGKVQEILVSGDKHSLEGINEPVAMRDSLVVRGVPTEKIHLDGDGYRTICSVVNAKKVFGYSSFIIISQQFHNERALYQADHLDLEQGEVYGYNAKSPHSTMSILTYLREYLARVKMFLDLWHGNTYIEQADELKSDLFESGEDSGIVMSRDSDMIHYSNSRFGTFCLSIPSKFKPEPKSFLDDGRTFLFDSLTWISATSMYNATDDTFDLESFYLSHCDTTDTYRAQNDNWIVRSGYDDRGIYYSKHLWTEEVIFNLYFHYSEENRSMMDTILPLVIDSWKID